MIALRSVVRAVLYCDRCAKNGPEAVVPPNQPVVLLGPLFRGLSFPPGLAPDAEGHWKCFDCSVDDAEAARG